MQFHVKIDGDETIAGGNVSMDDVQGFEVGQGGDELSGEVDRGRAEYGLGRVFVLEVVEVLVEIHRALIGGLGDERDGGLRREPVGMNDMRMAERGQQADFVEEGYSKGEE